jgi:hypothetical protein
VAGWRRAVRTPAGDQDFRNGTMGNSRRLKRALKSNRSRGARRADGYGGVKMSEVLMDFAEPLVCEMSLPEDREAFVAALKLCGLLWNEAVLPSPGGSRELYDRLNTAMGTPSDPDTERLLDAVIARGRLLYPDLDRLITAVDVDIANNGHCNVRVVSAVYA